MNKLQDNPSELIGQTLSNGEEIKTATLMFDYAAYLINDTYLFPFGLVNKIVNLELDPYSIDLSKITKINNIPVEDRKQIKDLTKQDVEDSITKSIKH